MGDEQDTAAFGPVRVEGAEPGLAQAGGEHHQAGGVAVLARGLEGGERLLLHRARSWTNYREKDGVPLDQVRRRLERQTDRTSPESAQTAPTNGPDRPENRGARAGP